MYSHFLPALGNEAWLGGGKRRARGPLRIEGSRSRHTTMAVHTYLHIWQSRSFHHSVAQLPHDPPSHVRSRTLARQ